MGVSLRVFFMDSRVDQFDRVAVADTPVWSRARLEKVVVATEISAGGVKVLAEDGKFGAPVELLRAEQAERLNHVRKLA